MDDVLGTPFRWFSATLRVLILPGILLLHGCSTARVAPAAFGPQAYYQTAYPTYDTSRELTRAFEAVKRIGFSAEYVTYVFSRTAGVTDAMVFAGGFESRADTVYPESEHKAGTATIISRSGQRIALLTVNHVTQFPPMHIRYYEDDTGMGPKRVASVAVRQSVRGVLVPHPGRGNLVVLARDERNDIALLGLELGEHSDTAQFRVASFPGGDSGRLSWGSFVYVVGYPAGYPMVTRGIVSNPDWDGHGSFVTDGLWNEGISGGLILAVRGETGTLEAVGLARAGAAGREVRLQPDTAGIPVRSESRRYEGALYIESVLRIQYGITLPISIALVNEFIDAHSARLRTRYGSLLYRSGR